MRKTIILTVLTAVVLLLQGCMADSKFDTPYRNYSWYVYDENGEMISEPYESGTENRYGHILSFTGSDNMKYTYTYSDYNKENMPERCVVNGENPEDGTPVTYYYRFEYDGRVTRTLMFTSDDELYQIHFGERDENGDVIRDRVYFYSDYSSDHIIVIDRTWENIYEKGKVKTVNISADNYVLDHFDLEKAEWDDELPSDCRVSGSLAKKELEYL